MEKATTWITSTVTVGLLTLVVGLGVGYAFGMARYGVPGPDMHMMQNGAMMQNDDMGMEMGGEMRAMMAGLEGKTGDAFDRAFIEEMIIHHEGAVAMAEALLMNTARPELRQLGSDIITAQTREIEMMRGWLGEWYGAR